MDGGGDGNDDDDNFDSDIGVIVEPRSNRDIKFFVLN